MARNRSVRMRVATGKVIDGKVVVEGAPLDEGAVVTIFARDADETFAVTPDEEAALLVAIGEVERGETVSAEEHLDSLRRRN